MKPWGLADILTVVTAFQLLLLSSVMLTSDRRRKVSQGLLAAFLIANILLLVQSFRFRRVDWVHLAPFFVVLAYAGNPHLYHWLTLTSISINFIFATILIYRDNAHGVPAPDIKLTTVMEGSDN
jgi:hypothetical protein